MSYRNIIFTGDTAVLKYMYNTAEETPQIPEDRVMAVAV